MRDFYENFYAALERSEAYREFCERVFGADLGQHGFADVEQLELLIEVTGLGAGQRVLDLGCGNGMIAEFLSDSTGAHVTGLDYIELAIEQARRRTEAKADCLSFELGDINRLELEPSAFDLLLSIDSIYFSEDYEATIRTLKEALAPGGRMAFFYSYGREPWVLVEEFPVEKLAPGATPLAEALEANGLSFQSWDLTARDYELALRRKQVLTELETRFEAENALFIYQNRIGDAQGFSAAIEAGLHARYLYVTG
ncbi:MAG: methyltransferase domain-containing protein [Gaiellaceae bacterium]